MKRRTVRLILLAFLALAFLQVLHCQSSSPSYARTLRNVQGTPTISFVSDSQSPLWFERIVLRSDDNEHATRCILRAISRDSSCTALFHLGDITGAASDDEQWEKFDSKAAVIRDAGIPIFPAFGNHEYLYTSENGRYQTLKRFPFLKTPWYTKRVGSLTMVMLNSNLSKLTKDEVGRQQHWYESTLDTLDKDSSVSLVFVCCHHAPYTNSTIVDPSEEVQKLFVPAFIESKKAKLFITGHSHAFEHFKHEGKDFLVIGGGGGLLHPLRQGVDERWHDLFPHRDARCFFHYVQVIPHGDRVELKMLKLNGRVDSFDEAYQIEIPFSNDR